MSDDLEIIQIGEPVDRPHEAEGARLTWTENHCELMMSFSNLKAAEVRGVEQEVFEFGLNKAPRAAGRSHGSRASGRHAEGLDHRQ